ncbi:MAG: hypothetical protein COV48_06545, partial [Elusimicrobia bacterium CG11_big_fil_rev_8_21_14_0_20_64_6]
LKIIHLDLMNGASASPLGSALLSGTTAEIEFAMPQPLSLSWSMRARFDGDARYAASSSTGALRLIDLIEPAVAINSPIGGQRYSASQTIPIGFTFHDGEDPSPSVSATLVSAELLTVPTANGDSVPSSSLSRGSWTLVVAVTDWAGNQTRAESAVFEVLGVPDTKAPRTTLAVGAPQAGTNPLYVSSETLLALAAVDDLTTEGDAIGTGVIRTEYSLDGASRTVYGGDFSISSECAHSLAFFSVDAAGNVEAAQTKAIVVDDSPPYTSLLVNGATVAAPASIVVGDALSFAVVDAGAGAAETFYSLDGSTQAVYLSSFSVVAGTHTLGFFSDDRLGHREAEQRIDLTARPADAAPPVLTFSPAAGSTVNSAAPIIVVAYTDADTAVDPLSVRLALDGVDITSQSFVTASSAAYTPPAALAQGGHAVSAEASDTAGNRAACVSTFFIDSIAPVSTLLVNGLPSSSTGLVLISTDSLGFAATDGGTGVLEILYAIDGSTTQVVYVSTFSLAEGAHSVSFRSRDRAGNLEASRSAQLAVAGPSSDTVPPLVRLDYPGAAGIGVEVAVGGIVSAAGAVSDASAVTWTLESAPGASATSGFATIASGAGNISGVLAAWNTTALTGYQTLRLRATDAFGNTASVTARVFVGNPVLTFAIGRKDSNVIVNTIKGPTGIAVRSDGSIWVTSTVNDKILLISPAGVVLGETGHAPGQGGEDAGGLSFKTPQGLALDAADNLYAADRDLNRVVKLSPDGQTLLLQLGKTDGKGRTKPGSGPGELRHPFDVAVDGNGDIYVADSGNGRIQVFNASGAFLRQFGPGVLLSTSEVRGIALTTEGLWVSDQEQERVFLFSRAGGLVKSIGDADSVVGEISRMRGLAADRLGALYVVEPNRDRTQKFDPQGRGLVAFGSKAGLSQADKLSKLYLTQPIDAAVAPDGSIWITDTGRDRIVRYALPASGFGVAAYSAGGGVASGSVEPAKRMVDAKDGAKVERDDGAGVQVPEGALSSNLEITVEKGDENQDKEQKTAKRQQLKITAVSEEVQYGPEGTTFRSPVTLTLPYDAALIAAQGLKEDDLKVYYWNPTLKDWQAMPSVVDKQNKIVNAQTNHFSAYQVGALGGIGVAAIDDFVLRDGYVFPNPSRNGSAVTFRMQPGSADSVEVRVYDLSGRKVHSSSDFRFRGAVDDGNGKGAQNTYDHVWDVSGIGSG